MLLATVVWICTPRIYGEYSYPSATESRFCCALFFQSCLRKSSIPSGPHSKTKIILGLTRTYAKSIIVTRQTRRGKKRKNLRRRFIIGVLQPPAQATGIEGGDRTVFPCSTPETSFYGLISCPLTLPLLIMLLYMFRLFPHGCFVLYSTLSNYVHTFCVWHSECSEEVCQLLLLSGATFTVQLVPLPQLTHYGALRSETRSHLHFESLGVLTTELQATSYSV